MKRYLYLSLLLSLLAWNTYAASDAEQIASTLEENPVSFNTSLPQEFAMEPNPKSEQQTLKTDGTSPLLKKVTLKGNTVFSSEALLPLFDSLLNKPIHFEDLMHASNLITEQYLKAGYVLSSAIIPEQEVKDGVVTIQVIEGYVDQIIIEDPEKIANERIKTYLNRILQSTPLHKKVLEENTMFIQHLGGASIQVFFKASPHKTGASDMVVKLSRKKIEGGVSINNDGYNEIGPWRGMVSAKVNNPTKHDDSIELTGVTTDNTKDVRAGFFHYKLPVHMNGTKLHVNGNVVKSKPSGDLESYHIASRGNAMKVSFETPLLLSREQLIMANGGVSVENSISHSPEGLTNYTDKFRSLVGSVKYESSDRWLGSNLAEFSLEYGMKGFGATASPGDHRSKARGSANFTTGNLVLSRHQHLSKWIPHTSMLFLFQSQYAGNTLLSAKRFGVGGAPYNRSYNPYTISGDSGFQTRLEAQYGKDLPYLSVKNYTVYAYYTYGRVWNRSPSAEEEKSNSGGGVGTGVRFGIAQSASWYLEYARPLEKHLNGKTNRDKVYTGISYAF